MVIGMHIDDAIYGPRYFGYGGPGEQFDRSGRVEEDRAPDRQLRAETVLVLVKASPDVIARRMKEVPRRNGVVREGDVEYVLRRFEEECQASQIANKMTLDTGESTVESTVAEFVEKMEPYFTVADRLRMVSRRLP